MNRAVFLDRDGVINALVPRTLPDGTEQATCPWTPKEFHIFPGTKEALFQLKQLGFWLIVITNQPEVGNGILTPETLRDFHTELVDNYYVDLTCYCSDKSSPNYKPGHGAILDYCAWYNIDSTQSFMVGDRWKDIVAGFHAGCRTVKVNPIWNPPFIYEHIQPNYWAADLPEAVNIITKVSTT